jgi:hypothetical protein
MDPTDDQEEQDPTAPQSDDPASGTDTEEGDEQQDSLQPVGFDVGEDGDPEQDADGNTAFNLEPEVPTADETKFYDNLVFGADPTLLSSISLDLLQKIEWDKKAREKRDKMYAEGIRRTGLGDDAPGGAQFQGASRVVHPMLTQATVEFESRVIKEIFPASGPVKMNVIGADVPKSRWKKAERKAAFLNWQLRYSITEFRPELEKVLTQSPLGGVAYGRWIWSDTLQRPVTHSCTSDQVLIPFAATSFYTAERITYIDDITHLEYQERVRSGQYVDAVLAPSSMAPDQSKVQRAQDKVEGREPTSLNEDGLRRIYHTSTYLTGFEEGNDRPLPYIVDIDDTSRKILSVVRNWEEEDKRSERMHWIIEWPFIPWTGAYPIGFMHMIGSLSGAATGALRALLDSAHVNNMPTAALLKGSGVSGQSVQLRATETTEINAGIGADDVRKRVLPVTYNPPSEVLFQLLEFLVQSGEGMVRVALDSLTQDNPNMPVGTMYAAIEQGLNVVGAIIGRYYYSMEQTLAVLHRINKMYITDDLICDETGTPLARREDFQGPLDCIPVADPATPSDAHRHAKIQAVSARAAQVPQLYNMHNVEKLFLKKMLNMPDEEIDQLLTPVPTPQRMNAVNENAAAALGRPISAFPEQDQLAHIQTHVLFMQSPFFGQLSTIAPAFTPLMLQHLTEHLTLWYVTQVFEKTKEALNGRDPSEFMKIQDPEVGAELDRTLAMVSADVLRDEVSQISKLPPVIQQAHQMLSQYQQQNQPVDPAQVMREKNQITAQNNQQVNNIKTQELQQRAQAANMTLVQGRAELQQRAANEQLRSQTQLQLANADALAAGAREQMRDINENKRSAAANDTKLEANRDDNMTALAIAKSEVQNDDHTDISDGTGLNPGASTNQ